jgi:hypothetical protein
MTHLEATGTSGGEMTLAEGAAMDEDEPGELVEGRLVEEEVPDVVHELCVTWLVYRREFDRLTPPPTQA